MRQFEILHLHWSRGDDKKAFSPSGKSPLPFYEPFKQFHPGVHFWLETDCNSRRVFDQRFLQYFIERLVDAGGVLRSVWKVNKPVIQKQSFVKCAVNSAKKAV